MNVEQVRRRYAALALITVALTYALIVFGGIVRITGSGMGCGEDWPLCNGRLIPLLSDIETLIEWSHRTAAALIGFAILGVGIYAWRHRATPGFQERHITPWAMISVGLLLVVVLFGRATVQLELPPGTVVVHLALASILLATLLVSALKAMAPVEGSQGESATPTQMRWAISATSLGYVVMVLGGLVATTGAAPLCTGFPLCNGEIVPAGGALVHLHWTHRLLAYTFVAVVLAATVATVRRPAPRPVRTSALTAAAVALLQIAVGAAMVLSSLPSSIRALHLAVGVALWAALVVWSHSARAALRLHERGRAETPAAAQPTTVSS